MASKAKRNAAIGGGLLAALLLLAMGMSGDDDDDDDDDDDGGGSPGGQDPPPPDDDIDPLDIDYQVVISATGDIDPYPGRAGPPSGPGGDVPWSPFVGPGEKPWNPAVYEHPNNYPTPGLFHQVVYGDLFGGKNSANNLAWAALYEGAYAAAVEIGGEDSEGAHAFAKVVANKGSNRARYRDAIVCGAWNDLLYATYGYSNKSKPGPHGRAIRLLPHHAANRDLIFQQQSPMRNIKMKTPADKGQGGGNAIDNEYRDGYEYLWFPALNLAELWNTGNITSEGMVWEDGSSMSNPPPEIWGLDIDVLENPGLSTYGCEEGESAFG